MYKIETHLHTMYASSCGKLDEKAIVSSYLEAGYAAVVVTDHYNKMTHWYPKRYPTYPGSNIYGFLEGYEQVKKEGARRGLRVFKGAEIRFDESINDYLLYGYDDSLLREPERVFKIGLEAFSRLVREEGGLLIQAHPCRSTSCPPCQPADPRWLDGMEVRNGNPRAHNNNDAAKRIADKNPKLLQLCGSDCHELQDVGLGGILAPVLPENDRELVELLRSRKFTLI